MPRQRGIEQNELDSGQKRTQSRRREKPRGLPQEPADQRLDSHSELVVARRIRAQALVAGRPAAAVAADIHDNCEPAFGTTWIRAYRLAHGIALTDVVEQVRAWYEHDGRMPPRFSETLLSAYESAQKRPGPEYLHYLCQVYRANPADLGYPGRCLCGRSHRAPSVTGEATAGRGAGANRIVSRPGRGPSRWHSAPAGGTAAAEFGGGLTAGGDITRGLATGGVTADRLATAVAAGGAPADRAGVHGASAGGALANRVAEAGGALANRAAEAGAALANRAAEAGAAFANGSAGGAFTDGAFTDGAFTDGAGTADSTMLRRSAASFSANLGAADPGAVGLSLGGLSGDEASAAADDRADDRADDVLRQTMLELMAGSVSNLGSRFFGAVETVRRRMDDALLRGSVSATMMDQWEETAAGYARQYMTVPPVRVLCDVLLDLGEVRRMCAERQQIEFQERLLRVASQLSALTGMIMIDIGGQRLARSFFRTARIAADETGDRCLRAWVAVRESLVPLYYGDPREAAALAHTGWDLAGRNSCVAKAMAPLVEARALARLAAGGLSRAGNGAADQARRMIARAHAAFDQLGQDYRSDTAFGYTTRQLLFHEGNALATLGLAEADQVLTEALSRYPAIEHLDRSLISFDQATCKLSAGDLAEALHIGEQTISDLPAEYRPEIVFQRARDLAVAAAGKAGRVPAVRLYEEAIAGR